MANGSLSLSIAKSALQAHQLALDTTAQNLSNANTPGYARKLVRMEAKASLAVPSFEGPVFASQVGTGVEVTRIEAVRDLFLNTRIRAVESDRKGSEKTEEYLERIELLLAGENDLGRLTDEFFAAFQDLAAQPESLTVRGVVRERGRALVEGVRRADQELSELEDNVDAEVRGLVARVNEIAASLAELNDKVANMSSAGLAPNDFEDKRQLLLEELAGLLDVQVVDGEAGTLTVVAAGQAIVQGTKSFEIEAVPDENNDLRLRVQSARSPNAELVVRSGRLEALLAIRDERIDELRARLDEFTLTLADRVNAIHRAGFGLDESTGVNFFEPFDAAAGERRLYRVESSTFVQDPSLPLDGDASTTLDENFEANPVGANAFVLNGRSISYDGSVDSLEDIAERINNAGARAQAYVTPENRLVITGTREGGYEIESLRDDGDLLARLGILPSGTSFPSSGASAASLFTGDVTLHPGKNLAGRFALSDEVESSVRAIAAAKGEDLSTPPDGIGDRSRGPGDGGNALAIAELATRKILDRGTATPSDFLTEVIGEVGAARAAEKRRFEALDAEKASLEEVRASVQGVSIDEELINLIKFQRAFQAAARIVSTTDRIFETLLALGR